MSYDEVEFTVDELTVLHHYSSVRGNKKPVTSIFYLTPYERTLRLDGHLGDQAVRAAAKAYEIAYAIGVKAGMASLRSQFKDLLGLSC